MRNIVQIANDPEFWRTCYGDAYLFAHEKENKVKGGEDLWQSQQGKQQVLSDSLIPPTPQVGSELTPSSRTSALGAENPQPSSETACLGESTQSADFARSARTKPLEGDNVSGKCIYCEKPGKPLCDECYGLKQRDITNMSCPDCYCDEVRYNQVENYWRCLSCGAEWNWLW